MKVSEVHPRGDRVVIEPVEPETVTEGGIHLAPEAQEKPQAGRVVAVGPTVGLSEELRGMLDFGLEVSKRGIEPEGLEDWVMKDALNPGDYILHGKYAGTEIEVDDETLLVLRDADILCRLTVEETPEPAEAP